MDFATTVPVHGPVLRQMRTRAARGRPPEQANDGLGRGRGPPRDPPVPIPAPFKQIVVDYLAKRPNRTTATNPTSLGPQIVEAVAGRRPPWLSDGQNQTLAALFLAVARQRGEEASLIRVQHHGGVQRRTWFGSHRTVQITTPLLETRGWAFPYQDLEYGDRVFFLGQRGAVVRDCDPMWLPTRKCDHPQESARGLPRRRDPIPRRYHGSQQLHRRQHRRRV